MTHKKLVKYLDSIFSNREKDFIGEQNAIDLFLEFYRNNQIVDDHIVSMLNVLNKKLNKNDPDVFTGLLMGTCLGIILGKFSDKIVDIQDENLDLGDTTDEKR